MVDMIVENLPEAFQDMGAVCQLTSSALLKPGARLRLWFILDRPLSDGECRRWLASSPVDPSLFRAVQPHYTASPHFLGCTDPVSRRVVLLRRPRDVVTVPALPAVDKHHSENGLTAGTRGTTYAQAALHDECMIVSTASVGKRHDALNRAAFNLGRFIATGDLDARRVIGALIWSARRAGIDDNDDELRRFLRSGLHAGVERAASS